MRFRCSDCTGIFDGKPAVSMAFEEAARELFAEWWADPVTEAIQRRRFAVAYDEGRYQLCAGCAGLMPEAPRTEPVR